TEDSNTKRFLWDLYRPIVRPMVRVEPSGSWAYTSTVLRQVNANTANQTEWLHGVAGRPVYMTANHVGTTTSTAAVEIGTDIGIDSTTVNSAQIIFSNIATANGIPNPNLSAIYNGYPGIGYHKACWLESGGTSVTFFSSAFSGAPGRATGISGW